MIEKLEQLAANECAAWFEISFEDQEAFTKEYAAYVDANPSETEAYLQEQEVTFSGVLGIAFEAISCFSNHPAVLLPAVKKVLHHSYSTEEIDLWNLEVLDDIDTIELYERDKATYMQYMDLLASCLRPEKDPEYLVSLLGIFEMAFIIATEPSENQFVRKKWFDHITELANYGPPKVKITARKVLASSRQTADLIPLTFMEKIKKFFTR
jgi:hypothetical protein